MVEQAPSTTIRDLEAALEWLKDHAVGKLNDVEKANPGLGESALFEHYKAEALRALDGLNPETVAVIANRAFLELRRKRAGNNPDHVIGA